MSQQDHFGSGFLWGTLFGGILGGVVGALVATRIQSSGGDAAPEALGGQDPGDAELPPSEMDMESARRGLEDKIAQLNLAIDDVRQRLGSNGQDPGTEG